MTNEELKRKIAEILDNNIRWQPYYYISRGIVYEDDLKNIADALIAAGLKFDADMEERHNLLLTACQSMEKKKKEAEHRAEVAERALMNMCEEYEDNFECDLYKECNSDKPCYFCDYTERLQQAERELAEERKDD